MSFITISGEELFAIGYPLFSPDLNLGPTLTKGHVSHKDSISMKTICSILPGSSGGALVDRSGRFVGLIVSNTKTQDNWAVYPRMNETIIISTLCEVLMNSPRHEGNEHK